MVCVFTAPFSVGNSVTGTMEISRAYEETTALLHGQVMLALSLHRAPAADDQQGRRPGGLCTASQPIQFSGDSLVLLASQLCLIQELGDGKMLLLLRWMMPALALWLVVWVL